MIGGTVKIKCSEEQYKSFCNSEAFTALIDFCKEHAVNLNLEFHSIVGIEWAQADYGTQNSSLTHDDIVSRLKPLGKIKNEIRDGSGCSILEPRSAREAALEWLNRKAEREDWYDWRNGIDKMQ